MVEIHTLFLFSKRKSTRCEGRRKRTCRKSEFSTPESSELPVTTGITTMGRSRVEEYPVGMEKRTGIEMSVVLVRLLLQQ
jgi:hypothetical protein